jgi:signal transduction histidine kinase
MSEDAEILIVEDSLTQAEQLKYTLDQQGYRVSVALNGKQAVAWLSKHKPQIVVSDILMPEMDGYQLCRQIKSDENWKDIPVLLLTSLSDPRDIVRGLECGADNFITKPYNKELLLSRVQYMLLNQEVRKQGRTQIGMEIIFGEQKYFITPEREQILDLLISSFETAVQKNLELIRVQDELRALNESLEEKVEQRTAALMQEIIERKRAEEERAQMLVREQSARAEAEAANRAKDEFLATVSHELRTPLTAILGWSHLLQFGKLDEVNSVRALETVMRNARLQTKIVDDLLDISRVITGNLQLNITPVEPSSIIEAVIESVRPAAKAKAIQIQTVFDPSVGPVSGDANRLQQVIWNLLSNAVKFTPPGGQVQVRLEVVNGLVQMEVSDTGKGISAEFLPYVFDRFRQADIGPTRGYGGLGLGLAIVRHLVELHGGSITAESRGEGQGATFTVRLRPWVARGSADSAIANLEGGRRKDRRELLIDCQPELNNLRILIVDDEPDTRELLAAMLKQGGAEVTSVSSVSEALEALEQWRPDILVSDIGMPEENGYELIRRVRALEPERGGRIPAVALTAYAREEDRVRALLSGFQIHVVKPVNPKELMAVVASLMGRTGKV